MFIHADICTFFCRFIAERVGVEFAADGNIKSVGFNGRLERFDCFVRNGRFYKDRFDFLVCNETGQFADVGSTGFAGGADALDTLNFETVISSNSITFCMDVLTSFLS